MQGEGDEAQAGRQSVQHSVQAAGLRLVFRELPRRLFFDQPVEAPHVLPDGLEGGRDLDGVEPGGGAVHHRLALGGDRRQGRGVLLRRLRDLAAPVLGDHRRRAAHEVAELVGELPVVALFEALHRDDPVLTEGHLAEEVETQRVDAVGVHDRERVEHVAPRLAHLLAAHQQVAVDELAGGHFVPGAHQQRRPDHGVELEDVLGEQVDARPVALERLTRTRVLERREIVDERVHPDVDDLLRVPGHGHAPGDRPAADGDVLETLLDEGQGLVVARCRPHPLRVRAEELGQTVLVPREEEVVVLLLEPRRLDAVVRAGAVGGQVALVPETLAGGAVQAAVGALLDVAGGAQLVDERLHEGLVLGVGRADEEVVGRVDAPRQVLELGRHLIDVLAWREPARLGGLGDLGAVLVGAGEEEDVVALLAMEAGEDVGGDRRVGVTQMRLAVDVVDRGGDVVAHRQASLPLGLGLVAQRLLRVAVGADALTQSEVVAGDESQG